VPDDVFFADYPSIAEVDTLDARFEISYRKHLLKNMVRAIIELLPPSPPMLDLAYLKRMHEAFSFFEEFMQFDKKRGGELLKYWFDLAQPILFIYWRYFSFLSDRNRFAQEAPHLAHHTTNELIFAQFTLEALTERLHRLIALAP